MGIMWTWYWVWVASTSYPGLFPSRGGRRLGVAYGLCVNTTADVTLSSEDDEIENLIETAVSRRASLIEPEKASISRKRKVIVNDGQYKASREHKSPDFKTSVWDRIKEFPGQHLYCVRGQLRCLPRDTR